MPAKKLLLCALLVILNQSTCSGKTCEWKDEDSGHVKTATCNYECCGDYNSANCCSTKLSTIIIIVGCVVGGIAAIGIVIIACLMYKKAKSKPNRRRHRRLVRPANADGHNRVPADNPPPYASHVTQYIPASAMIAMPDYYPSIAPPTYSASNREARAQARVALANNSTLPHVETSGLQLEPEGSLSRNISTIDRRQQQTLIVDRTQPVALTAMPTDSTQERRDRRFPLINSSQQAGSGHGTNFNDLTNRRPDIPNETNRPSVEELSSPLQQRTVGSERNWF